MLMEKYDLLSSKAQNFMNQEKIEQNLRLAADLSKDTGASEKSAEQQREPA